MPVRLISRVLLVSLALLAGACARSGSWGNQDSGKQEQGGHDARRCSGNETLLAAGPVLYLRLDERSGTRIADASGRGNDGVLTPGGESLGEENTRLCGDDRAMRFFGNGTLAASSSGGYIEVDRALLPHPSGGPITFTISLWYRYPAGAEPLGVYPHLSRVITIGQSNGDEIAYLHDGYPNGTEMASLRPASWVSRADEGSGDYVAVTYPESERPRADTWHHLAATHDGSMLRAFLDGELSMTGPAWSWGASVHWDQTTVAIAASGLRYSEPRASRFNGWVDEVAVFDKALTRSQIARIYEEATSCSCPPERD